jgi:uncharacterized Tic20 family protein
MAFCAACQIDVKTGKFCTTCGRQLVDAKAADPQIAEQPATSTNRNLAMWAHLAPLLAVILLGWLLVPLLLLWLPGLLIRNSSNNDFVGRHALESINFQLSLLIYGTVSVVLTIATLGLASILLLAVILAALIYNIMAIVAATSGKEFHYPIAIRFVK